MESTEKTEILFRYKSKILEEDIEELLWAEKLDDNHFRLMSIPFFGPPISTEDIFTAIFNEKESIYEFDKIIAASGNSILQVILHKDDLSKDLIEKIKALNCETEQKNDYFFCVLVKSNTNIISIIDFLENESNDETFDYAEAWLSKKHLKEMRKSGYLI